ncbi:MAG TPA: hypothetical protein VG407_06660 [Caulobacteraceae bacterium]|jgi:hypothetical protein|nr:hypothetical protein [Caulobacteraceae bacterium]
MQQRPAANISGISLLWFLFLTVPSAVYATQPLDLNSREGAMRLSQCYGAYQALAYASKQANSRENYARADDEIYRITPLINKANALLGGSKHTFLLEAAKWSIRIEDFDKVTQTMDPPEKILATAIPLADACDAQLDSWEIPKRHAPG